MIIAPQQRKLFLPFTPSGRATELTAIAGKKRLGMTAYESVEPIIALKALPARLVDHRTIEQYAPDTAAILFNTHADDWSAIGYGAAHATGSVLNEQA